MNIPKKVKIGGKFYQVGLFSDMEMAGEAGYGSDWHQIIRINKI